MNGMQDWVNFYAPKADQDPNKKKSAMYAAALGGLPGLHGGGLPNPYELAESGAFGLLPKLIGGENLKKAGDLGGFGVLGKLFG